jgi:hypothetical protein
LLLLLLLLLLLPLLLGAAVVSTGEWLAILWTLIHPDHPVVTPLAGGQLDALLPICFI